MSAHRTPDVVVDYCKAAQMRGLKVIIAGAGMSAALPGVAAAHTSLPVIGVPILGKSLNGMDSLFSVAQMPPGRPGRLHGRRRGEERRPLRGADHRASRAVIPRYTREEIGAVWTQRRKMEGWLEVELAVTEALADAGTVPADDARACPRAGELHGRGGRGARADDQPRRRRVRRRRLRLDRRGGPLDPLRADLLRRPRHRSGDADPRRGRDRPRRGRGRSATR